MEPLINWWLDRAFRCRDSVIQRGAGAGLRFNPGRAALSFVTGTHEPEAQRVLRLFAEPGLTLFDVGANVGFYSVIAARLLGSAGRVVAFEPLPENARWIEHNAALNGFRQISTRCEALGESAGEARFFVSEQPTWGKLVSAGDPPSRSATQITVGVQQLDALVMAGTVPRPNIMKMDVEGGEVGVLKGATETLSRFRPLLVIDLHGTNASVAEILEGQRYQSIVIGSALGIVDSPWDACVVAAPAERADLVAAIQQFAALRGLPNEAGRSIAQ